MSDKTIVFISCVKTKRNHSCKAEDMYISPLFKKSLAYAKSLNPDNIFILSAKYGAISLDEIINPYELTLSHMRERESNMDKKGNQTIKGKGYYILRNSNLPMWIPI